MTPTGPDPSRVVQVRSRPSFGTGYLIEPGLVLTAAHVVAGAPSGVVTVGVPGEAEVEGELVWSRRDERVDAALIRIDAVAEGRSPVRYGEFVSAVADQAVEAIGFPRQQRFKAVRDQEQLTGRLSPATGAVSGHYELASEAPLPGDFELGRSPWSGMSGAAIFSRGLLVGVLRSDRLAQKGTRLIATTAAELLADSGFRSALSAREPVLEPVEFAEAFESPYSNRDLRSVASLLRADSEIVRFGGREAELRRLDDWCDGPELVSVLIVTGPGGEGKSRIAREMLSRRRERGWATGLLRPTPFDQHHDERLEPIARMTVPLLIAVDYAEIQPHRVRALLRHARAAAQRVRVLLLARDRGDWAEAPDELDADVRDLLAGAPELRLPSLTATPSEWDAAFQTAVADFAVVLPQVPGYEAPDWTAAARVVASPPVASHRRPQSALGLQMAALTMLLQESAPVAYEQSEPLERTILRHEEAYWMRSAQNLGLRGLDRTTLRGTVAALRLMAATEREQAIRMIGILGMADSDRGRIATRWLRELYPAPDGWYLGLVQPDRLAEFLLGEACAEEAGLLARIIEAAEHGGSTETLAGIADRMGPAGTSTGYFQGVALREAVRVARALEHSRDLQMPLLTQIEQVASGRSVSDEALQWAAVNVRTLPPAGRRQDIEELPDGTYRITSIPDRASAALEVAATRRGLIPKLIEPPEFRGTGQYLHAMNLAQLGRTREALEATLESIRQARTGTVPDDMLAHRIGMAGRLQMDLGLYPQAAETLLDEVRILEADGRLDELADACDMVVVAMIKSGQSARAIPFAVKEAELRRTAPSMGDEAVRYLKALGRCAEMYLGIGSVREAVEYSSRAEALVDEMLPGAEPELARDRALLAGVRASIRSAQGDGPGTTAAWLEAASHWRRVEARHDDQDPGLWAVTTLNNAAVNQADAGDHAAALRTIREAVELALSDQGTWLCRNQPDRYEAVHATYVGYLVISGDFGRALEEAEQLWNRPVPSPEPLPISFANSLREAAIGLAGTGRLAEAVRSSRLAVAALDATAVPEQVMPLLATTLSDLAANLAESRETAEGAEVAARAVEVWRRVRQIESAIGVNIVSALLNLAECLRAEARYEEALGANAEATRILREEAPGAAAPMLGDLAWQRAKCHTEVGDHRSAVEARLEECKIRRPLAQSDRTQQLRLARCYTELATGYKALEQPLIALDAAGTAAGIYYDLFGPAPGSNGPEVARALAMMGDAFCRVGQPAKAVASFLNAISMAHEAGDVEFAQAMGAALNIARAMDPVGVQAELDLLLGPDH